MRRLQHAVLRTSAGPLRPLWRAGYAATTRLIAAWLRRFDAWSAVYVGGSLGFGEPVYGLSDLDVIVVTPGDAAALRRRRDGARRIPFLRRLLADAFVYTDEELRRATAAACPISHETFLRRDQLHDEAGLTVRPGPFGPTREWRLIAGPERRHTSPLEDAQARRLAAWLDLQFWWRFAFRAAQRPSGLDVAFLCVKLIAEPARLWLWLVHGRMLFARSEVLRAAIDELPSEREAFELALALAHDLPREPSAPLALALAAFTRQSAMLATVLDQAADSAGYEAVALAGARAGTAALPLADWRALVAPAAGPEHFVFVAGDPSDAPTLARLGRSAGAPAPALRDGPLLVRPACQPERAKLRAVQCAATDPVSFALADARSHARFPRLAGWSAHDWARRAVAEHRVWLGAPDAHVNGHAWIAPPPPPGGNGQATRNRLLAAARAGLFLESIGHGEPELLLSLDAAADRIGVEPADLGGLRRAVARMPAYR
jgi:hypothetical protein